jgi:hypothetical protein
VPHETEGKIMHRGIAPKFIAALALLAGASFCPRSATATTITFDDLSDNGLGTPIANGYQGFDWTNWFVLNTPAFTLGSGPNGFAAGTVSPPNVAFNGAGDDAIFSDNTFTFSSVSLTAAWRNGLRVTITGKLFGATIDMVTLFLSAINPTLEILNWTGIDEVDLSATGGVQDPTYSGDGTQVAMDNLTITTSIPTREPSALAILAGALGGLAFARQRALRLSGLRRSAVLGRG